MARKGPHELFDPVLCIAAKVKVEREANFELFGEFDICDRIECDEKCPHPFLASSSNSEVALLFSERHHGPRELNHVLQLKLLVLVLMRHVELLE